MSFEIPTSLIQQIQSTLRREAGIPTYDPTDPSLPDLPTLEESIAKLDDDDNDDDLVRCKRCRGGLLRGIQSTLCIYCGRSRKRDGYSHSINFNSTLAYRNLLDSLGLQGSEAVNLNNKSNDSNKGQDTPSSDLVLSSLLGLELKWPPEKEETDISSTNKAPSVSAQAVNLAGVDLGTFFSDTKNETASSVISEQLVPKEQPMKQIISTESRVSSGSENFGFIENRQSLGMAVSFDDSKSGDFGDSIAWEAEFQSANSEAFPAESKSFGHFNGSSATESTSPAASAATFAAESQSTDFFQGPISSQSSAAHTFQPHIDMEREASCKDNSQGPVDEWGQFSSSSNWIQDDLFPKTADPCRSASKTDSSELKNEVRSTTSISNNQTGDDMWPSNSLKEFSNNINITDNSDLFESWKDIANANEVSRGLSTTTEATTYKHAYEAKPVELQDVDFGSFFHSDSSSGALGGQKGSGSGEVSGMELHDSVSTDSIKEFTGTNITADNDVSLEAWQDFTSSTPGDTSNPCAQPGNEATSSEYASGNKSRDQQDMGFDIFLQSDSFSGALGGLEGSSEVNGNRLNALVSTSSIKKHNEADTTKENDYSLEDWQDFTSSIVAPGDFSKSSTQAGTDDKPHEHASGTKSPSLQDMDFGSFFYPASVSGALNDQIGSSGVAVMQLDASISTRKIEEFNSIKSVTGNDNSSEDWQDFTSSNEAPGGLSNSYTQTTSEHTSHDHASGIESVDQQDMEFGSFLHSTSFSGALNSHSGSSGADVMNLDASHTTRSIEEFNNIKSVTDNDDFLEDWQDFTSSSEAPGGLSNSLTEITSEGISHDHASGIEAVDNQNMEFGNFLHSDSLLGVSGGHNGSNDASGPCRITGMNNIIGSDMIIQRAAETDEKTADASKLEIIDSKVEALLAQMPDLSFILDNNLSIPRKADDS